MIAIVAAALAACSSEARPKPPSYAFPVRDGVRFMTMPLTDGQTMVVRAPDVWICSRGKCTHPALDTAAGCPTCSSGNCDCRLPACAPVCEPDGLQMIMREHRQDWDVTPSPINSP